MKTKLLALALFVSNFIIAQTSFIKYQGFTKYDIANSLIRTNDSSYCIGGYTDPNLTNESGLFFEKINQNGDTIWTKNYKTPSGSSSVSKIIQLQDSTYMATGYCSYNGNYDWTLVKLNKNGDTLWTKGYGGGGNEVPYSLTPTSDKGFLITGYTRSYGLGLQNIYLIKTDAIGDTLWTRVMSTDSAEIVTDVIETADKGFLMVGQTWGMGEGEGDGLLMKTDSMANIEWSKIYGGRWDELFHKIIRTQDGNYLIAGNTESWLGGVITNPAVHPGFNQQDLYILKVDQNGDTLWTRTYGDAASGLNVPYALNETKDGDVFISSKGVFAATGQGYYLKINATTGDTVWSRLISGFNTGSSALGYDGGYLISGTSYTYKFGRDDIMLAKADVNGDIPCYTIHVQTITGNTFTTIASNVFNPTITNGSELYAFPYELIPNNIAQQALCTCNISVSLSAVDSICNGDSTVITATTLGTKILWNTGDTTSTITVKPTTETEYYAIASNDTCSAIAYHTISIKTCVGIEENELQNSFSIYPNPTTGKFTIVIANGVKQSQIREIEVYNILGELIFLTTNNQQQTTIDLSSQPSGIYFIQLKTPEGIISKKIIKN